MSRLQTQATQATLSQPVAQTAPPSAAGSSSDDDFLQIDGLGYVFARRLQQAGVTTFGQLAGKSASEIESIVKPQSWQTIDVAAWIEKARSLSGSA